MGREVQEEGGLRTLTADSRCCMAEINISLKQLSSNLIKKKKENTMTMINNDVE